MEEKFGNLNIQEKKDINILLLGETGVGKSTFINSIANYLHHKDLKKAKQDILFHVIPCMFNITDEQNKTHKIVVGKDSNEFQQVGSSATQDVRTYVFPIRDGNTRLRLIDSPGMGDPRGVDQDDINCENILTYIGQLHELHAICFLFKPNDSRITITFEYCVKQILSRLDKSAAMNIIFILTNTKGTHYKPGETIACLKQMAQNIRKEAPNVDIKVDQNVFCFDNETFRYLAASKNGVVFSRRTEEEYLASWRASSSESEKLIKYIVGDEAHKPLKPHHVRASTSINEVRRMINQLGQPLTDISQLILDNLRILDRREEELKHKNFSLEDLRSKLFVPIINLRVIRLSQPATVCCDAKCSECVLIDGAKLMNYKQRCHDPCYLKNVPQEIVGASQLRDCASMNPVTQKCLKCGCAQTVHMHIYYMTEKFDDKKIDTSIQTRINTTEKALAQAERVIIEIKKRRSELEQEKHTIINCAAKFAAFVQKNAITPFNDAYRKYLNYMIFRESKLRGNADQRLLHHLHSLLSKYDNIKETFDRVVTLTTGKILDPKDISAELLKLFALKHNGNKIRELYMSQKYSRKKEYEKTEYVHSFPVLNALNNTHQPKTTNYIVGTIGKREFHKKNNKNSSLFKPYKSQTYFNSDRIKNGVKTVVSRATGLDENIEIEINEFSNSNRNYKNNSNQVRSNRRNFHDNLQRHSYTTQLSYTEFQERSEELNSFQYVTFNSVSDNASYDNRPPYDNRSAYDNRPPYEFRDHASYDNRPPYDHRDLRENRSPYNNRPPYFNRPPYNDYDPHDNRPFYDNRDPHDNRTPYDHRAPYNNRPPYNNRASYDSHPPHHNSSPPDNRHPYGNRNPYDIRSPYDNRPPYHANNFRESRTNKKEKDTQRKRNRSKSRQSYKEE